MCPRKGAEVWKRGGRRPHGIPWLATSNRLLAATQLVHIGCLPMAPPPTCNFFCLLSLNFHKGSIQSILAAVCIQRSCILNIWDWHLKPQLRGPSCFLHQRSCKGDWILGKSHVGPVSLKGFPKSYSQNLCCLCPLGLRLSNDSLIDACLRSNDLSTIPFTLLSSPHRLWEPLVRT